MVSQQDKAVIVELARRYGVGRVLLFGSGMDPQKEARDIDLGVEGADPARFFQLYGDLIFSLSKPVDLVDLGNDTKFNRLVRQRGVALYERGE